MAIPDYETLMLPLLEALADGAEHPVSQLRQQIADTIHLSKDDLKELLPGGSQPTFNNRVGWAKTNLDKAGAIATVRRSVYQITQRGRDLLASKPATINSAILRQFPEYRTYSPGSGVNAQVDRQDAEVALQIVESLCPDEQTRISCLSWIADAIRYVHERESGSWGITLQKSRVRLNVGRMLSFDLMSGTIRISLAVPLLVAEDTALLAEHAEWAEEPFAVTPECRFCTLPTAIFLEQRAVLKSAWLEFLRIAIRTGRQTPFSRSHSPGVVAFMERALASALPRPTYKASSDEDAEIEGGGPPLDTMAVPAAIKANDSGQLFKETFPTLNGLLHEVDSGDLGLPDIQRPFVWKRTKVRDLIDSMYRGFPVGYLLFWETPANERDARPIGLNSKDHDPKRLIIDGQQRLTSLYAVLHGKAVQNEQFREQLIEISFRPRDSHFAVASAATRKDPEYISNISEVWRADTWSFTTTFLEQLEQRRQVTPDDRSAIAHNIARLAQLERYKFSALEILSSVSEEAVADIFVRINSQGKSLNQADFILTLLSVHWDQGRRDLEDFSRACTIPPYPGKASPFNHFIKPSPDQLLRVAVSIGFHRGKLRSVYQLLRGKDPGTGRSSPELRNAHFARLKEAQPKVLDLINWHGFLDSLVTAGFRGGELISSEGAVIFAYAFYLIGKLQCGVDERALKRLIGRWFFATSLTTRYTSSTESALESDLARVKDMSTASAFVGEIETLIEAMFPPGYWSTTLPDELETSGTSNPAMLAYLAAQNRLGAPVLFSDFRVADLLDPALVTRRKKLEQHHLFPKKWLERHGIVEPKQISQAANFALVEWVDNSDMSDSSPAEYLPPLKRRFSDAAWARMNSLHALPAGWESMAYDDFLKERRPRMANIIRQGFAALSAPDDGSVTLAEGTPEEQSVWSSIPKVEQKLREVVHKAFGTKFGDVAEARMRALLGEKAWELVERHRGKDTKKTGSANSALEYVYLRQLIDLLIANDVWDAFKPAFKEKQRPIALIDSITAVRNDLAHFRSVAPLELDRCRIACIDMLNLLAIV